MAALVEQFTDDGEVILDPCQRGAVPLLFPIRALIGSTAYGDSLLASRAQVRVWGWPLIRAGFGGSPVPFDGRRAGALLDISEG